MRICITNLQYINPEQPIESLPKWINLKSSVHWCAKKKNLHVNVEMPSKDAWLKTTKGGRYINTSSCSTTVTQLIVIRATAKPTEDQNPT